MKRSDLRRVALEVREVEVIWQRLLLPRKPHRLEERLDAVGVVNDELYLRPTVFLTDVDDAVGRHVVKQLVYQNVALPVELVLGDADVEELQVAHVLPCRDVREFSQRGILASGRNGHTGLGEDARRILPSDVHIGRVVQHIVKQITEVVMRLMLHRFLMRSRSCHLASISAENTSVLPTILLRCWDTVTGCGATRRNLTRAIVASLQEPLAETVVRGPRGIHTTVTKLDTAVTRNKMMAGHAQIHLKIDNQYEGEEDSGDAEAEDKPFL